MGGPVPGPRSDAEAAWHIAFMAVMAGLLVIAAVAFLTWALWAAFGFKGPFIATVICLLIWLAVVEIQRRILPLI